MIKTAILGQGYWGTKLYHTLQKISNCDVKQSIDVKNGQDIDEIADDIEAVVIATPPQTHFELIKKSLDKNLHIFVEKPICQSSQECNQLDPLVTDKVLMTGHILLYNDCTQYIKDNIDFNQVNRINIVRNNWGRKIVNKNVPDMSDILFQHKHISINIRYTWLSIPKIRHVDIFSPTQICHWDDMEHSVKINQNYMTNERFDYEPKQTSQTFIHEPLLKEMTHFFDCNVSLKASVQFPTVTQ